MNLWILGSAEYKNSGIYKYSKELIDAVSDNINIKVISCPFSARSLMRYLWQFLYLPLYLLFNSKHYSNVIVYEEGLSFLSIFIKTKSLLILHDIRDSNTLHLQLNVIAKIKICFIKWNKYFIGRFSKIVCVSDFTYECFINQFPRFPSAMVVVIPNIIRKKKFEINKVDSAVKRKILNNSSLLIIYVGSDEVRKNTLELYKAILHLSSQTEFVFIRVGRSIDHSNFKAGQRLLKDQNNVLFLEEVSEDTLWFLYDKSDVFIMPSLYEGFGRTPVEAQTCGTVVISTLNSGLKYSLSDSVLVIENNASYVEIVSSVNNYLNLSCIDKEQLIKKGLNNSIRFSPCNVAKLLQGILSA